MEKTPENQDYQALAQSAMEELLSLAAWEAGEIVVVGCSSSEVAGWEIGSKSSPELAAALVAGLLGPLREKGLYLAAQCCEHLNRALILEKEALRAHRLEQVNVVPRAKAGGAFATAAWQAMEHPVAAERVAAVAGLDIGATLIGMHLRPVAVPLRLSIKQIGKANVMAARTRPKFIGGARAHYDDGLT